MLYSLRTALLVTMLAVTMVAIGLTTLYASLTTRFEFTRFLESGRDLRNEQVQEGILRIMRQELATIEVDNAEGIINPSGTAMLASGTGFVLNPGNFRIYTLGQDNHVDLTKTRAINPSMDLRFEISSGGQTQLYEGNTRVGVVYTNPITDIEMMPAQIEFVQSVNDGIMAGALLASAVAIVVALFLSRQILQPIQALKSAAQRMEEGDFSHKVRTRARGELGELTQAFNSMRTALAHQEQLRRNMVSDIAHELRTPLTNLRGYLEALQDGFIEPNNDTINLLHDEAMLLNRLVQDLQELALVEAGQLHIHRQAVAMDDTIRQTIAIVQPMARRKDIQLTTDIADDLPVACGDERRIAQILRNLIHNAIKYTPEQGRVWVRAHRHPEEDFVIIQVEDTGGGIPDEHLPFIFERFYRVDSSRNRATGGAGLGLAICKHLVEAQGGTIEASSRITYKGKGACLTFTLPIVMHGICE